MFGRSAVSRTASRDDSKKAYRKSAIKNHPDKGGDPEKAVAAVVDPQQHKFLFCNPNIFGLQTTTSNTQHGSADELGEKNDENGVTEDQKQMMHLWNSFVRKQRVLADGDVPLACEAFTKLHGPDFMQNPGLLWCWRMLMMILWSHGLLDPSTMQKCNVMIEKDP